MNNLRGGRLVLTAGILHVIFSMLVQIWRLNINEYTPPDISIRVLSQIGWIGHFVVFLTFLYLLTRHEKAILIAAALYAPSVLWSILSMFMSPQSHMGLEAIGTITYALRIAGLLMAGFMIYRRLGFYGALIVAGMYLLTSQHLRLWDIPFYTTKSFDLLLLLLASLASASKYVVLLYWHRLYESGAAADALLFRKVDMSAGMAKWKGTVVFLLLGWAVFFMAVGLPKNLASMVYKISSNGAEALLSSVVPSFILNVVAFLFTVWCFRKFILEQYYAAGSIPGWGYWALVLPLLRFIPWLTLPMKAARKRTAADGHATFRMHRTIDNDHFKSLYWLLFITTGLAKIFLEVAQMRTIDMTLVFIMAFASIASVGVTMAYLNVAKAYNFIAIFAGLIFFPFVVVSVMRDPDAVNNQFTYLPGLVSLYMLHPLFHPERIVPYPELPAETAIIHPDS
jgi:hypothetical protein